MDTLNSAGQNLGPEFNALVLIFLIIPFFAFITFVYWNFIEGETPKLLNKK